MFDFSNYLALPHLVTVGPGVYTQKLFDNQWAHLKRHSLCINHIDPAFLANVFMTGSGTCNCGAEITLKVNTDKTNIVNNEYTLTFNKIIVIPNAAMWVSDTQIVQKDAFIISDIFINSFLTLHYEYSKSTRPKE